MAKPILNMHIDPKLKEQLQQRAKDENRSLANLCETLLRQALSEKGK